MKYKITFQNPTQQYIPIEARMPVAAGSNDVQLQFPAWRPGRYELGNFAKNVKNFTVTDTDNRKLAFHKIGKDSWQVECEGKSEIIVRYYYYAAELNAGSTYMDDTQLYVNPVNCLVYVPEQQNNSCTLALELPADFKLACGAQHANNIIQCSNYHELVDSPFIASAGLQCKTYTVLGKNFYLWFQGMEQPGWDQLIPDFERFTLKQIEKFSDRKTRKVGFPVDDYHFLFQILPYKAYHGVEHQTSTVIALGPEADIMGKLYDSLLGVSSHELYHTWNIKALRPAEMYPYNYARENFSHLGYVAEGVTTYLGDLFLAESNVRDFDWFKAELEKLLTRHFYNFGRFNYSVAESSWDTWLDGYVPGAPYRKVSIYNEGALLALVMDLKIRKASQNKASIHDVMNYLYVNFAEKEQGYTEADYQKACELYAETSLTDFFRDFVHGTRPYESILTEAFETVGFTLEMKPNPDYAQQILGIQYKVENGKTIITQIYPGSTAELGSLMIGDEILTVNQTPVEANITSVVEQFKERSLTVEIKRMGRQIERMCPNTNRAVYPVYYLQKVKTPANLNKRIFKKWAGYDWDAV